MDQKKVEFRAEHEAGKAGHYVVCVPCSRRIAFVPPASAGPDPVGTTIVDRHLADIHGGADVVWVKE